MKFITPRQFTGYALFFTVLGYAAILYKLIATGWYLNATTTTLVFTGAILGVVAMILWNMIVAFIKTKKETKK